MSEARARQNVSGRRGQGRIRIMRGKEFADLVYQSLIIEKETSLEDTAEAMKLSYHSLHARIHNKTLFSADEIRALMRFGRGDRFANYLLDGTGLIAVEHQESIGAGGPDGIFRRTNRLAIETGNVLEAVEAAMVDNKLDHRDKRAIRDEILLAEKTLVALRQSLEEG